MPFVPSFAVGDVVDNKKICKEFKCSNMGGMRRSHIKNCLVIISDHTKLLYDDKWYDDVLHYTGMGKNGDQSINFMQNKTLAESNSNGIDVHLFEVFVNKQYVYRGIVRLCGEPYQEIQDGDDGVSRKVWMFPVKIIDKNNIIDESLLKECSDNIEKRVKKLNIDEIRKMALIDSKKNISMRKVISHSYDRSHYISLYVKILSKGVCELCNNRAPFNDSDGFPYLEGHHVKWMSKEGEDDINNVVALCPNCHRKMHVLNLKEDVDKLIEKIKSRKLI